MDSVNKLVDGTDLDGLPLKEVMVTAAERKNMKLYNNAAQAWNHEFYFQCMRPPPKTATEPIVPDRNSIINKAIKESFGSYKKFRRMFVKAANNVFGSGWVWLVYNAKNDDLEIKTTSGADNPLTAEDGDYVPLLTIDMWEHAYYDYHNGNDYVDAFADYLINWLYVEKNLKHAIKDSESKVSGSMITSHRLQCVEDCSECTMITISPKATFTIHGLQFYTELEHCLKVEVWYV